MSFLINEGFVESQFTKGAERGLAVPLVTFINSVETGEKLRIPVYQHQSLKVHWRSDCVVNIRGMNK